MTEPKKVNPNLIPGGGTIKRKKFGPALTPGQKAEAAALWRSGEVTLEVLGKKFKKRPETFGRLFKDMGITKGEAAREHQAKVTAAVETKMLQDVEVTANRIAKLKETAFVRTEWLGKLVLNELGKAVKEGKGFENIRGSLQSLQLAAATLSKLREDQYVILEVEKHDNTVENDDLPDLTVRELSQTEVVQLQSASFTEDEMGGDMPEFELDTDTTDDLPPVGQGRAQ